MHSNFLEIYKNNINLPECAKFVLNLDNVSVSSNVDVVLLYTYIVLTDINGFSLFVCFIDARETA
jgi:hypothetical protein